MFKRIYTLALQALLLIAIWQVGVLISDLLPFVFPGAVLGMILLALLLMTRVIKERWIDKISDTLLSYMSLFFIPAAAGILLVLPLLQGKIIQFVFICFITTVLVFATTAGTVSLLIYLRDKKSHNTEEGA